MIGRLKANIQRISIVFWRLSFKIFSNQEPMQYTPDFEKIDNVNFFDISIDLKEDKLGWQFENRIIFLVPLRDAALHLPLFFSIMKNMTYPHHLIDMAFLVSDSKDNTMSLLYKHLNEIQSSTDPLIPFGSIEIFEKNFGQSVGQGFSDRHGYRAQGSRRKNMARARNWLTAVAVKPCHKWIYWRDVDVETVPNTILEDLMNHDKDVIVPNVWRPLPAWLGNQQPYDLNSWQESDGGIQLAKSLDEDAVIVEGYQELRTWRPHLAYLRDPYGDPNFEMELDGVGGVSILAKAKVFRIGANFPAFTFMNHAETEGFGKMCKRMDLQVIGLPHYTIWHIYEPSDDDLKHMAWMDEEEKRIQKETEWKKVYDEKFGKSFEHQYQNWDDEKSKLMKHNDPIKLNRLPQVFWEHVDEDLIDPPRRPERNDPILKKLEINKQARKLGEKAAKKQAFQREQI
ncbi:hypothetical protein DAMA08_022660 [Martiniozyma asiatica (nom. inval.)]|nr:hypothetical protein DAMA08_022660 [Martiniozyma asiatica]